MRTCAAALAEVNHPEANASRPSVLLWRDAVDLLLEASNALDAPEHQEPPQPLGAPMAILDAPPAKPAPSASAARWGGLPAAVPRPCPKCGSIDARTVHRDRRKLMLTCPVCSYQWEYKP
jgi:hypothetical protein